MSTITESAYIERIDFVIQLIHLEVARVENSDFITRYIVDNIDLIDDILASSISMFIGLTLERKWQCLVGNLSYKT